MSILRQAQDDIVARIQSEIVTRIQNNKTLQLSNFQTFIFLSPSHQSDELDLSKD